MEIEILTIFPEIFEGFIKSSLLGKASSRGLVKFTLTDIRQFASPPHFKVDDTPYGGGAGMVLSPEPLARAIEQAKARLAKAPVILLSPSGSVFNQGMARDLSSLEEIILVCGRYEGVDQRVVDLLIDQEISIGDYVLMGGEVGAMVVIEAVSRLIPGVLGNEASSVYESFATNARGDALLEAPQYTRPAEFRGLKVPEVLLEGNHAKIASWRNETALKLTQARRPNLIKKAP